jgi:hypothetical protein
MTDQHDDEGRAERRDIREMQEATAIDDRRQRPMDEQRPDQGEGLSTAQMAAAGERQAPAEQTVAERPITEQGDRARTAVGPGEASATGGDERVALFSTDKAEQHRSRWQDIQADFVDDPRQAVEQADQLVAQLMKELAEAFASERAGLERSWERGDDISTEELRITLQRYRSFFGRLLSL